MKKVEELWQKWLTEFLDDEGGTIESMSKLGFEEALTDHDNEIKALIDEMIEYYQILRAKDAEDGDTEGAVVCDIKIQVLEELKGKL